MRILVTGGAGFIGAHVIEHILKNTDWDVVSLDRLDTSGTLDRITDIDIWQQAKTRVSIVHHDLKAEINDHTSKRIGKVNVILHLAASSHVDRSIIDPLSFVMDNVVGTCNLLDFARNLDSLDQFLYFGTDEIFGPAPVGVNYKEWDRYKPGNPYAASKCGAEDLCIAFHNTYQLPLLVTHTMNVFGERQHREKFLPSTVRKVLQGETVTIHSDSTKKIAGSRFYIHARNVASALLFLLGNGKYGEKYNIVGEREIDNLELAQMIAANVGKSLEFEMVDFHSSRPGHDLRYALDGSKLAKLGWDIPYGLEKAMEKTVQWYTDNKDWL